MRQQVTVDSQLFQFSVFAVTPFGVDEKLMLEFAKTTAYPVLDVGWLWNEEVVACIRRLTKRIDHPFGLRISAAITLPNDFSDRYQSCISAVIFSSLDEYRRQSAQVAGMQVFCEVVSVEEALEADQLGLQGLIVKGNEAGGRVGDLASFIFMQQVAGKLSTPYWVQGGMGPFSALAAVYSGASGVVYDSQFAMMGKWARHARIGAVLKSLNGSETEVCHGYRYVKHGLCQSLQQYASVTEMLPLLAMAEKPVLMAGMDVALANLFAKVYHDPQTLVHLTETALQGRFSQLQENVFQADSTFAQALGLTYPLVQGPMTRVSDEPAFAAAIAEAGALPTIACAVLSPKQLDTILGETTRMLDGKPWAAGLLAFMPPDMLKPQVDVVLKHKPNAVVLAGGRSEQCKQFVEHGIVPLVHCPTASLFQQFLKDGVKHFIFEGRECGGHIGPMSSMTLWEMQITLAMDYADPESLHLVFAGGIHDSLSAHMVSAMVSPLAERGVRLGLLAGTAYIFCQEAVETKAILENFQQQAIAGRETAVVETGVGHVTRCLKTDYVDYLAEERRKMEQQGLSKEEIFVALEQLNVGHLRIASKGVKRDGDQLVAVSLEEQNRDGMFMIGDVALMRHEVTTLAELHAALSCVNYDAELVKNAQQRMAQQQSATEAGCAIAIVGMAARFAGSANIDEYWLNILEGRDLVTEVDDSRWSKALYFDPNTRAGENEKSYSKWGAFIDDFAIDPTEFGIPPQTLSAIDAGQLAALRVAKDALVDAGYTDPERLHNTSVIFGYEPGGEISGAYGMRIFMSQIAQEHPEILADARQKFPKLSEDSFAGILGNVLAGRVSNRLNLGGQNFTIDAACASSLAAIDAAVKELRYGESDMVIAGGVDFHNGIQDYVMFCSTYALSHKGKCFSFSAEADGIALGEGMAAVVLKRLEDAEADGDRIYGVIQGIAGSSDGKSLGLTAPRREGQKFALHRAYQRAGVSPKAVGLVEAHGTGTVVGDRTELTALDEVYRWSGATPGSIGLGTVKTQIGHTKCAAGVASLIKGVLATQYGILPPTLNIETPNAQYNAQTSPFVLNNRAIPWISDARLAGVSSFGFGGTNYHAVVGNAQADTQAYKQANLRSHELFCFAAETMQAALAQVQALSTFIQESTMPLSLAALALAQSKRTATEHAGNPQATIQKTPVQIAIVVSDVADLQAKLQLALKQQAALGSVYLRESQQQYTAEQTAFLFAGQGSQFVDMGRELFNYFPALRQYLAQAGDLRQLWFPPTAFDADAQQAQLAALTQTEVTQPLLGLLGHAVAHWLGDFGIKAQAAAGHSYGELAAMAYAGAIPLDALTSLSRARAQAIVDNSHEAGGMLAVACDASKAQTLLQAADAPALTVANLNSPLQTVLTGSRDAVQQGLAYFERASVKCTAINTPYAFHSALIADAEAQFAKTLTSASLRSPQGRVWSNLTAQAYADASVDTVIHQLSRQIVSPVRYQEMIEDMYANGVRVFIEVGPGAIQTRLVKDILADKTDVVAVATVQAKQSALRSSLQALAQLNVAGVACDLTALYAARNLPSYDLSQPLRYKPSTWLVNGHYARPLQGEVPASGFLPARAQSFKVPATITQTVTASVPDNTHSREQVMHHYLSTLNQFVEQQKSVMMQYLGAAPVTSIHSPMTYVPEASISHVKTTSVAHTPSQATTTVTAQAPASAAQTLSVMNKAEITTQVVAAIAVKTGYPAEMIAPQLDLESDLGIDSIKRMELLASLAEQLGLHLDAQMSADSQDATELLKKVAGLKSAEQIADWMLSIVQSNPAQVPTAVATAQVTPVATNTVTTSSAVVVSAQSLEQMTGQVITAIAEKTGYPVEMIEPQLDLESDLGIDSIKRMELLSALAERLGMSLDDSSMQANAQDATELLKEVAGLKTAAQIAAWMHQMVLRASPADLVEVAAPLQLNVAQATVATQPSAGNAERMVPHQHQGLTMFSLPEMTTQVVEAIAEKTGYPVEMIEPQLDLESDLGIDSIKRMELLSTLAERLGIPMDSQSMADSSQDATALLKEVAGLKTAAQIASWMHRTLEKSFAGAKAVVEDTEAQQAAGNAPQLAQANTPEKRMVRYETHYLPCDAQAASLAELGKHALVIADGDVQAFTASLQASMQSVNTVSLAHFNADALTGKDAVFWVLDHTANNDADSQSAMASSVERFEQIFKGFQTFNPTTLTSVTVIHLCAVSQTPWQDASLGNSTQQTTSTYYPEERIGVAGLVAALRREWPKVNMACLYLSADAEAQQQTAWLQWAQQEQTLQVEEGQAYVYRPALYHAGKRYRRTLVETPVQALNDHALSADDVVVVVGGAKGITQWTAAKLAQQYGCHLVIIGRSALQADDVEQLSLQSADALRQQMIAQYAGQRPIAEIQSMIARETQRHQLVAGIRELQQHAKSVTYYQADSNHLEQIQTVMQQVMKKLGTISACIYGAGMIRDKFIQDKTMQDARTVYDVKTLGYSNFVHAVMAVAKPRIVIAYSSISAILGSRGQSDYAAANEALEYWSLTLGKQYPDTRFSSVGWGPWTGVGMVDSALEEHLSRYQIYAISREEGAQFLADELASLATGNTRCFAFKSKTYDVSA